MKKAEEVLEILEAYDLTGSLRAAASLSGCDHKTVAHWVARREEAQSDLDAARRAHPQTGPYLQKVEELVCRSHCLAGTTPAH